MVLSAQMGKAGPPMDGKDLHIGDLSLGHPAGGGAAEHPDSHRGRHGDGVSRCGARTAWPSRFIGEGGCSLGEWHEAINLCAARRLPGDLLRAEQPDRALHPPARSVAPSASSPTRRPATASPG